MAGNQLRRQYLTLLEAVDNILESTGNEEEDINILSPVHGDSYATDVEKDDVDKCHRNDLLPNDVARTLEIQKHINPYLPRLFFSVDYLKGVLGGPQFYMSNTLNRQ